MAKAWLTLEAMGTDNRDKIWVVELPNWRIPRDREEEGALQGIIDGMVKASGIAGDVQKRISIHEEKPDTTGKKVIPLHDVTGLDKTEREFINGQPSE